MKRLVYSLAVFSIVIFLAVSAGASAVPVSPADESASGTVQNCPTFSWSASAEAVSYRIEIYEQVTTDAVSRERMKLMNRPVVVKDIAAPALSWTPSSAECLSRGVKYVWYVQGLNADGQGAWSGGKIFSVDPSVLSLEQKDAVQEVVKEYLSGDSITSTSINATGITDRSTTRMASAITPMAVGPISATGDTDKTFLGNNAGFNNTGGSNTFIGAEAGHDNTSGWANTFVGYAAGQSNSPGTAGAHNNTFVGQAAGWKNTSGNDNTYIGNGAGQFFLTSDYNTYVGSAAGTSRVAGASSLSTRNSFFGYAAGTSNYQGDNNTFLGADAGRGNTLGSNNVYIGSKAGYTNDQGNSNIFIGYEAGYASSSISQSGNVYVGNSAGRNNTGGLANVFIGDYAGYNSSGNFNVFIGSHAGYSESGSSKLIIANSSFSPLIYGEFDTPLLQINAPLTVTAVAGPSDERYKKNIAPLQSSLDKVMHLRGVSYDWKTDEYKGRGFKDGRQIGLIAQEVEKVLPELVQTDGKGYKSLSYDKIVPVLIEAIKEQQRKIEDQQMTMIAQRERIEKDERLAKEKDMRMDKLEQSIQNQQNTIAGQQNAILLLTARMAALEGPSKSVALK